MAEKVCRLPACSHPLLVADLRRLIEEIEADRDTNWPRSGATSLVRIGINHALARLHERLVELGGS